jgi:nitrogenase molybdenum-iron protein alpha/beta subunit
VDLLIGNTYGKYIARDENIPFVRMASRSWIVSGHSYFPTVGYGCDAAAGEDTGRAHGSPGSGFAPEENLNW